MEETIQALMAFWVSRAGGLLSAFLPYGTVTAAAATAGERGVAAIVFVVAFQRGLKYRDGWCDWAVVWIRVVLGFAVVVGWHDLDAVDRYDLVVWAPCVGGPGKVGLCL